jgi:hypothetical protein
MLRLETVREGVAALDSNPGVLIPRGTVREGFEPSVGFKAYGALAKLCFRPLSHLTLEDLKICHPVLLTSMPSLPFLSRTITCAGWLGGRSRGSASRRRGG